MGAAGGPTPVIGGLGGIPIGPTIGGRIPGGTNGRASGGANGRAIGMTGRAIGATTRERPPSARIDGAA